MLKFVLTFRHYLNYNGLRGGKGRVNITEFENFLMKLLTQSGVVRIITQDFAAHTLEVEFSDGTARIVQIA